MSKQQQKKTISYTFWVLGKKGQFINSSRKKRIHVSTSNSIDSRSLTIKKIIFQCSNWYVTRKLTCPLKRDHVTRKCPFYKQGIFIFQALMFRWYSSFQGASTNHLLGFDAGDLSLSFPTAVVDIPQLQDKNKLPFPKVGVLKSPGTPNVLVPKKYF